MNKHLRKLIVRSHQRDWPKVVLTIALLALMVAACAEPITESITNTIGDGGSGRGASSLGESLQLGSGQRVVTVERVVVQTVVVEKPVTVVMADATPVVVAQAADLAVVPYGSDRKIIKHADVDILVTDSTSAVDRITSIAVDHAGYVLSTNTWYEAGRYLYATVTIAVPVDAFEKAMRRVREVALRVEQEAASGEDVTSQYVDLESQVRNLEATSARVRQFLDKAQSVEEALRVNKELSNLESQIEELKGRMQYLRERAAYSTITVNVRPERPTPTATGSPTPTPTSTPTTTPTPQTWFPQRTYQEATGVLTSILKTLADGAIWFGVVCLPLALMVVPLILLVTWLYRRSRRRRGTNPATPDKGSSRGGTV